MRLLLDTHAILWMVSGDPRLPESARKHIRSADKLFFSPVSFWEMGIKTSLGKPGFQLGPKWASRIENELRLNGVSQISIQTCHCARVATLPWHHRDPFDRMLIAQAVDENLTVLTKDLQILQYDLPVVWNE